MNLFVFNNIYSTYFTTIMGISQKQKDIFLRKIAALQQRAKLNIQNNHPILTVDTSIISDESPQKKYLPYHFYFLWKEFFPKNSPIIR